MADVVQLKSLDNDASIYPITDSRAVYHDGVRVSQILEHQTNDLLNVNVLKKHPGAYDSSVAARNDIDVSYREKGLCITYLDNDSSLWIQEQFIGTDASSGWSSNSNWQTLGPVSVINQTEGSSVMLAGKNLVGVSQNTLSIGGEERGELAGNLTDNIRWVYIMTDAERRILFGILIDGKIYFGEGCPSQVRDYIQSKIEELSLTSVPDIISFLNGMNLQTDNLHDLLTDKVDKEDGKTLIPAKYIIDAISQSYINVICDADGRILSCRDKDGVLHEFSLFTVNAELNDVKVNKVTYLNGIPEQISQYVQNAIEQFTPQSDVIPYNDLLSIGGRILKIYNPYKNRYQNQFTGQMHCHTWTKFSDSDYPSGFPSEKWKVPYGYSIGEIPSGATDTEKYLWGMPHEKLVAILNALATAYIWRMQKLGFDFATITDYAQFGDVTHKPNLSSITYLQQTYPDAYTYFASLYLDGFDADDFDANGELKNFAWLSDGYETVTKTSTLSQHQVVHGAPNDAVTYNSGTFDEVMERVQGDGCVSQLAHPTYTGTPVTEAVVATIKKNLRLMEIYDGITCRKYNQNGVLTNIEDVVPDVMLDEPFDEFLVQGNFVFGMAISDERPTYGRTGERMFIPNPSKNLKNGCVKVFCDELSSANIYDSLLAGNFYAVTDADVEINSVTISDGLYTVDVGVEGVVVEILKEGNTIVSTMTTSQGNTIASYPVTGEEKFVRARLYKLNGLPYDSSYWYKNKEWILWTQPMFISQKVL